MNNSLNSIAENLAFSLGEQFNFTLRESIKHTVCLYREKLLREEDFNFSLGINDFVQNIVLELEDWENELCGKGKITIEEIPASVRFKTRGRVNYNFVGNKLFNRAYTQTTLAEYEFIKNLPDQINPNYYVIENNKIILLDNTKQCDIGIKGIFSNPQDLVTVCKNVEEVDDDAIFPITGDMLAIIRKGILSGDFPIRQMEEKDVITSNSENNK